MDGSNAPGTGGADLPIVGSILNIGNILGGGDGTPATAGSPIHVDLGATDLNVGGSAGLITTGGSNAPGTLLNLDLDGDAATGGGGADVPLLGDLLGLAGGVTGSEGSDDLLGHILTDGPVHAGDILGFGGGEGTGGAEHCLSDVVHSLAGGLHLEHLHI